MTAAAGIDFLADLSCRRPRAQSTATPQSADYPGQRHSHLQASVQTAILSLMQPQPAFDTHDFVKRLTKVGMPEDQAEILAKGQSDLYERLVTKEYFAFTLNHELEKLRAELKNDIDRVQANLEQVKAELKNDIDRVQANLEQVKAELKNDIETVKAELKHELDQHKAANRQALKELELTLTHNMKEMEQKLIIKLGALLGVSVMILAALIKFL